jgi:HEPN domain-containing protein
MNATVREWTEKAAGDYATAARELRVASSPNYDAVCFHAQQAAEKWMKALLIHLGITPSRSHDLVALDRLLAQACSQWSWPIEELRLLSSAAVTFRYPGESAGREEAIETFDIVTRMRDKLLPLCS